MGRLWLVAVMLLLGACGVSAGDGSLVDDWAALDEARPRVPVAGCHDAPLESSYQNAVIRTAPVPCEQAHTVETFHVGQVTDANRPGFGSVAFWRVADECERLAPGFLGGQWYDLRLDLAVRVPSAAQWDGGGRWFHCDLMETADRADSAKRRTGSLRAAAVPGTPLSRGCVTMVGKRADNSYDYVRPIDCAQPHDAEYAGSFKVPNLAHPTEAQYDLYDRCYDVVARYVGGTRDGIRLGYLTVGADIATWNRGDRYTRCYAWASEGPVTGSVRGLGNRQPS